MISGELFYEKILRLTGWNLSLVRKDNYRENTTTFQRHISEDIFSPKHNLTVDEIYFSGEQPFIQIKKLNKIENEKIRLLHSKIWNEGRSPFLVVITPSEMRVYNCYASAVEHYDEVEQKLQLDRFENIEHDLKRLVSLLHQSKIDSGKIWEDHYGKRINLNNRVDKKLVANLKNTRVILHKEGKGLPLPIVHSLLGRSLFILYLEDRNILKTSAFPKKPKGVKNFFDLLSYKEETYELFEKLKEKFNGDLFPISSEEKRLITPKHLELVKRCFFELDIIRNQTSLWKMFQFDYIPIELISAIYEEFMSEEDKEKNGNITIKKNGAYYTKPMLVEFILNEVLPWPDKTNTRFDYKILDPACGSGIFLVESYRRLIARWKYSKRRKKIDEHSLREILHSSIFGIDKDSEAIKVTAFSLYLTFLNYLEPVEIRNDYIRKKRKRLAPLIYWSDAKEVKERKGREFGKNLFQLNTFASEGFLNEKFDIIVGNPPWKKDKPEPIVAEYITSEDLPAQIACAFLNYMPTLSNDGVIALVVAAKILFNTGNKYETFRQRFFSKYEVETVINLSVVREIMFDNATSPGAVIIYRNPSLSKKENIVYCVPKNIRTINNNQSLVIDSTEVKYITLSDILKENSKIFKIAMWGNMRDSLFIDKLQKCPSILTLSSNESRGTGLHLKDKKNKTLDSNFRTYKSLPLKKVQRYFTPDSNLHPLGSNYVKYRAINKDIFSPPIILLKRGTIDTQFCCSFVDYRCVYTDRIYGLCLPNKSVNYCKALVASLNSSLATYYLFLISSTWAVDKQGDTLHDEILSFPAITELMDQESIDILAQKTDEISELFMNRSTEILRIEKEIDQIIFTALKISNSEQKLIENVLNNSIGLQNRYTFNGSEKQLKVKDLNEYTETLSSTLLSTLKHGNKGFWIEVLDSEQLEPIHIVIINFNNKYKSGTWDFSKITSTEYREIIKDINTFAIEQHSESIYYRKAFKYFTSDKLYLIKTNEKRFWNASAALNDADSIISDLINAKSFYL